ncbi:MAG: bifunctional diaminohydroxyphosphoribosylaminopyrimidine deaminase/5-amino-6-(5-phosphoribosylamino)uracil reductase RibD [Pseudomonadota bacterium]
MSADQRWMKAAFALGARGLGTVWPNPAVGCILVKDGRVIGRGWTQPGGRPHAEVMALRQAGTAARDATAYVTLEPCSHHGKTGPCAEALLTAGIARLVGATQDPDPRVAGRGYAMLEEAGVDVTRSCLPEQAEEAHGGFFARVRTRRPLVTLKLASSIDGRIATGSGDSRWITGSDARRQVHMLRSNHDAVLVGTGTMLADDPDLGVRGLGPLSDPVRIVADRRLRMPANGRLASLAATHAVWALHGPEADPARAETLRALGVKTVEIPTADGSLELNSLLSILADEGLTRVFCEGGGTVAASLLASGLIDRLVTFGAGVVIGAEGQPNFGGLGLETLSEAPRFTLQSVTQIGGDIRADWLPIRAKITS